MRYWTCGSACLKASTLKGICFAYMWGGVHRRVWWGLVRVPGVEVRVVGVVMGVVSLRVVVPTLPVALAVVVMDMVLIRVGRGLQVLVRMWVHVMVGALLLPWWHHLHHVAHGVHVAIGDGTRVVWKCCLQSLRRQNGQQNKMFNVNICESLGTESSISALIINSSRVCSWADMQMTNGSINPYVRRTNQSHSGCPLSLLQPCHSPALPCTIAIPQGPPLHIPNSLSLLCAHVFLESTHEISLPSMRPQTAPSCSWPSRRFVALTALSTLPWLSRFLSAAWEEDRRESHSQGAAVFTDGTSAQKCVVLFFLALHVQAPAGSGKSSNAIIQVAEYVHRLHLWETHWVHFQKPTNYIWMELGITFLMIHVSLKSVPRIKLTNTRV